MPESHRAHLEWSPQRLIDWARSTSGSAAELMEALLASRPHPEHAYRAGMGIMGLARRYGPERFEAACARAVASGAISYSSVKSILAEGLDRLPLPRTQVVPPPPSHDNLRGAGYYAPRAPHRCGARRLGRALRDTARAEHTHDGSRTKPGRSGGLRQPTGRTRRSEAQNPELRQG